MSKVTPLEGVAPKPKLRDVASYELSTLFQRGERWNPDDLASRKGLQIYRQMMTDEQVKAVVQFKRDAITSRGWTFSYPDHSELSDEEKERRINLFTELVQKMRGSFEDALNAIASGRVYGFSLTEKIYDNVKFEGKTYIGLHSLLPRDASLFVFYTDEYGVLEKVVQRVSGKEHEIKLPKFIHYVHAPDIDRFYGESDLRQAYRSWYVKDQVVRMYATYLERFAGGFAIMNVTNEAGIATGSKEHDALKAVLANMRNLAGAIMPPGVEFSLEQPGSTGEYREALTYFDQAIAKSLLVPNLLGISHTGQTGSFAQSQTQLEAFFWTINADTKRLEACLNEQLFRDLGDQNLGDGDYPEFKFKPASFEHSKWVVDSWAKLLTGGAVISTEQDEAALRAMLDMPAREEDSVSIKELNAEIDQKFAPPEGPPPGQSGGFGFTQRQDFHTPGGKDHDQDNHAGGEDGGPEIKLPPALRRELAYLEVDTFDPETSSPERAGLVKQLESGAKSIRGKEAIAALDKALDNLVDLEESNGRPNSSLAKKGRELRAQIRGQTKMSSTDRAFFTAVGRVDFALIEQRSTSVEAQAIDEVSATVAKAVKRLLTTDRMRDYLGQDVTAIENVKLEGNDVGRIKAAFKQALQSSWDLGMVTGRTELGRANFATPSDIARVAGDYIEANGFRMAANLSDAVRAVIQQQLLNAIRFGVRPEEAELMIYRTLVEKGMLAGKSVLLDGAISFLEGLLRVGGMDEDDANELADRMPHYVETLVRTNTFEALNEARFALYSSPEVAWFVAGLEYSALIDGRTTQFCQHMHGRRYTVDNPIWNEYRPPNHYNCRSLLIAITKTDAWDGTESPPPELEPQEGFKASEQQVAFHTPGGKDHDQQNHAGGRWRVHDSKSVKDRAKGLKDEFPEASSRELHEIALEDMDAEAFEEFDNAQWKAWKQLVAKTRGNLSKDQRNALATYVQEDREGDSYYELNAALRKGTLPEQDYRDFKSAREYLTHLDSASRSVTLETDTVVFRGIANGTKGARFKPGTVLTDRGFTSTTMESETALEFATDLGHAGGRVLQITLPKGTRVGVVDRGEHEILLPRGSSIEVTKKLRDGGDTGVWVYSARLVKRGRNKK